MVPAVPAFAANSAIVVDSRSIDMTDKVIPQHWLDQARSLDVSFGHQSVGLNIIDGLKTLARQNPRRYGLTIQADPTVEWFAKNKGLGHYFIGRNEYPESKITDFARHVQSQARNINIAMMKFCFVDIMSSKDDPEKIFASYRESMERLERSYPAVRFVWWTQPLSRSFLHFDNSVRYRYNMLVRNYAAAHHKPLFDIADIESHDPSGSESRTLWGVPRLYPGYTEDGGHLVADGQLRAARAWWWLLARLAGWPGPKS